MTVSSVLKTLSVVTVATTAVVSTIAPAQALNLNGSISVSGDATIEGGINPASTILGLNDVNIGDLNGDFAQLSASPNPTSLGAAIEDLTLNLAQAIDDFTGEYSAGPVDNFLDFGTLTIDGVTDQLTFDLDAITVDRFRTPLPGGSESVVLASLLTGEFEFNGQTVDAVGGLTASLTGQSDTYQFTLQVAEPVPEPLTILGSLSALGMGAFLKKQQKKS
ncbi:MAG: PEP-CTERM sorting domain-containing protein [Cyanobacteria bacterium J06592_8]